MATEDASTRTAQAIALVRVCWVTIGALSFEDEFMHTRNLHEGWVVRGGRGAAGSRRDLEWPTRQREAAPRATQAADRTSRRHAILEENP